MIALFASAQLKEGFLSHGTRSSGQQYARCVHGIRSFRVLALVDGRKIVGERKLDFRRKSIVEGGRVAIQRT